MKVTVCPKCRITPEITPKEIKCPKCGRFSIGESLTDALIKWNDGKTDAPKKAIEEPKIDEERPRRTQPRRRPRKD